MKTIEDVKDMFEKFTLFDRHCFLDDFTEGIYNHLIKVEDDKTFAMITANSLTHFYSKVCSITEVYQEYIGNNVITDAIVEMVYNTVYKRSSSNNSNKLEKS